MALQTKHFLLCDISRSSKSAHTAKQTHFKLCGGEAARAESLKGKCVEVFKLKCQFQSFTFVPFHKKRGKG